MTEEMKNRWMPPREAAGYLGITEKTLGVWMHQRRMQGKQVGPAFRTFDVSGRQYRVYSQSELDDFIEANCQDGVSKRNEGASPGQRV